MKDLTDTVNDVCTDCCYVMGYNYIRAGRVPYGRLLFVWDMGHHIDVYADINKTIIVYEMPLV